MPQITLSDAVDVISKSGSPKATKVSQIKNRPPYHPAIDYYRPLRSSLVAIHSNGRDRRAMDAILPTITDAKKLGNYHAAIEGYKKWWGRKNVGWFDPPRAEYASGDVSVLVNPELGLEFEGTRYMIKLYMKDEKLEKLRIDPALVLMELALRPVAQPGDRVAVLDVRKSKLHVLGVDVAKNKPMVDAELGYIAALWPNV